LLWTNPILGFEPQTILPYISITLLELSWIISRMTAKIRTLLAGRFYAIVNWCKREELIICRVTLDGRKGFAMQT